MAQRVDVSRLHDMPVDVIIVLDNSTSLGDDGLNNLIHATNTLIGSLNPRDRVALVTFSQVVVLRSALTNDTAKVREMVRGLKVQGSTSVIDASFAAAMLQTEADRSALMLVFSDGLDTASWLDAERVLAAIRRAAVVPYAVVVGSEVTLRGGAPAARHARAGAGPRAVRRHGALPARSGGDRRRRLPPRRRHPRARTPLRRGARQLSPALRAHVCAAGRRGIGVASADDQGEGPPLPRPRQARLPRAVAGGLAPRPSAGRPVNMAPGSFVLAAMNHLLQDVRFGLRLLWKQKGFALTTILTLAACIGANATIFSVVNAVLLRPLPFPEADRLVSVNNSYPGAGVERASNGVPDYFDRKRDVDAFEEIALYRDRGMTIGQEGRPERVQGFEATPSLFRVLKAQPFLGRLLNESDGVEGQNRQIVISYALWQRMFGGRNDAIGKELRIQGRPYTVVGVLPREFMFLTAEAVVWVPLAFNAEERGDGGRHSNNYQMIARLKPGRSVEQAQQQIDALNAANMVRFPQFKEILINARFKTQAFATQRDLVREVRATLYLLWGGVAFVLLIGARQPHQPDARPLQRAHERARHAHRARRGPRPPRASAAHGNDHADVRGRRARARRRVVGAAVAAGRSARGYSARRGNRPRSTGVAFTVALAFLVGIVISLIPIVLMQRMNLNHAIREEGRSGTASRGARLVRRALVASQVAFAFMLLVAAGLLLASFQKVLRVDPGFETANLLTGQVNMPASRYQDPAMRSLVSRALDRIRAVPGVLSAGATSTIPCGGPNSDSVIMAEGYVMKPGESLISPAAITATPGYFETLEAAAAIRPLLHAERHGHVAEGDHPRRSAREPLLRRPGSDRPPHVAAGRCQRAVDRAWSEIALLSDRGRGPPREFERAGIVRLTISGSARITSPTISRRTAG